MRIEVFGPRHRSSQGSVCTLLIHNASVWTGGFATSAFEVALLKWPGLHLQGDRRNRYFTFTLGWLGCVVVLKGLTLVRRD